MINNEKKYTAITGASSGIGYASALEFANRNKNLILIARREQQLQALKQKIAEVNPNIQVIIKICDLSQATNVHSLFEQLNSYYIETWINNAGFGHYGSVEDQNLEKIQSMLHLNIEALTI